MSKRREFPVLAMLAIVVWGVGAIWSWRTWQALGVEHQRTGGRQAQLATLQQLAAEHAGGTTVQERARAMASASGSSLAQLLERRSSAWRVEDSRERVVALGDGWVWREHELVLGDAPLGAAMGLIDEAERLQPPWRLRACEIRASAHTPGNGQVTLTLGTLAPAP